MNHCHFVGLKSPRQLPICLATVFINHKELSKLKIVPGLAKRLLVGPRIWYGSVGKRRVLLLYTLNTLVYNSMLFKIMST